MSGLVETVAGPSASQGKKKKRGVLVRVMLPGDNAKILDTAQETAAALQGKHVFFRRGEAVVFPSPTGEPKMLPMTDIVFRSEIEKYVSYFKPRRNDDDEYFEVDRSLNKSDAETILSAPEFWKDLPEIKRVHPCPLPVLRPDGNVVILQPGYDEPTGIYTFTEH